MTTTVLTNLRIECAFSLFLSKDILEGLFDCDDDKSFVVLLLLAVSYHVSRANTSSPAIPILDLSEREFFLTTRSFLPGAAQYPVKYTYVPYQVFDPIYQRKVCYYTHIHKSSRHPSKICPAKLEMIINHHLSSFER